MSGEDNENGWDWLQMRIKVPPLYEIPKSCSWFPTIDSLHSRMQVVDGRKAKGNKFQSLNNYNLVRIPWIVIISLTCVSRFNSIYYFVHFVSHTNKKKKPERIFRTSEESRQNQ